MNILVSGEKNAGKTTLCKKLIEKLKDKYVFGGVICPDVFEQGMKIGSDAIDISTGERKIMMRQGDVDFECIPVGPKCKVSIEGLELSKKAITDAIIDDKCDVIVVDHIGLLERDGKGIIVEAVNALSSGKTTITLVRDFILEKFLEKYPMYTFESYDLKSDNRDMIFEEITYLFSKK